MAQDGEARTLKLADAHVSEDFLRLTGPDDDGEYVVQVQAVDEHVILQRAQLVKLHAFIGKLLEESA